MADELGGDHVNQRRWGMTGMATFEGQGTQKHRSRLGTLRRGQRGKGKRNVSNDRTHVKDLQESGSQKPYELRVSLLPQTKEEEDGTDRYCQRAVKASDWTGHPVSAIAVQMIEMTVRQICHPVTHPQQVWESGRILQYYIAWKIYFYYMKLKDKS